MAERWLDMNEIADLYGPIDDNTIDRIVSETNVQFMKHSLPRFRRQGQKVIVDSRLLDIVQSLNEENKVYKNVGAGMELFTEETVAAIAERFNKVRTPEDEMLSIMLRGDSAKEWLESQGLPANIAHPDTLRIEAPCMPVDMPEQRMKLLADWGSQVWTRVFNAVNDINATRLGLSAPGTAGTTVGSDWEINALNRADLWWVGADMCDLLYATMPKVPGDVEIENLTVPSAYGFVILAKPWTGIDATDGRREVLVDAVVWGPARLLPSEGWHGVVEEGRVPCISISCYRFYNWEEGLSKSELQLAMALNMYDTAKKRTILQSDGTVAQAMTGTGWLPLGRSDWPSQCALDASMPIDGLETTLDEQTYAAYKDSAEEDRRFIASLFTLLATHSIAETTETQPQRQVRRRIERAGITAPSKVKVVYLRRPDRNHGDHTEGEGSSVQWSHRWVVSAHMRNQPYGPQRSKRRLILIPAHVKGPADLPVVVKETVRAWVR